MELLSPVITPFVILFDLRPRAHRFVDFFREHSVNIEGLGDVCSFATMEVAQHGDPVFQASVMEPDPDEEEDEEEEEPSSIASPSRDGKTEMSLMHFAAVNPEWRAPASSQRFLERFRRTFHRDVHDLQEAVNLENNLLRQSIFSLVPMSLAPHLATLGTDPMVASNQYKARDGFTRMEGPPRPPASALGQAPSMSESLRQSGVVDPMSALRMSQINANETAAEMSLNALYLYGLRSRKLGLERSGTSNYGSFRG
uniref:Autophagy-related protein 9 n=1 Tax=Steinernema glaseri TaxID=37863 RepID=A0A1I8A6R6_9BILA